MLLIVIVAGVYSANVAVELLRANKQRFK